METHEANNPKTISTVRGTTGIQRRALLAKIHIAAKELAISDVDYRALLMGWFGVPSAADLSTEEMERLLEHFVSCGWQPMRGRPGPVSPVGRQRRQAVALRARARQILSQLEDKDERRLQGLCEKICGSRDLASCRDVAKLRRILAVLTAIRKRESLPGQTLH